MEGNQNAGTVEMSKNFPVSVERLFEAWNEPEQLKQWWHPLNNHLENVKNDLKEGGTIEYEFENHKLHISGNYKQVSKNEKLVYSWNWELEDEHLKNGEYILSIDFIPEQNGSRLQIRQEGFSDETATKPHKEGWDQGLASLEEFLSQQASGTQNSGQQTSGSQGETIPVMPSAYDQPGGMRAPGSNTQPETQSLANQASSNQQSSDNSSNNSSAEATQQFGGNATLDSNESNKQQGNAGGSDKVDPSSNTTNATQENFDPAKRENSVTPEY